MAKVTPQQIAGAAKAAGFPDNEIATATAVGLAESGGETDAINRNTNGSVDYGVWQINTIHGPLLSTGNKFDLNDNARMAFTVWQRAGGKWTPWSAYKNSRYRTFMPQATLAAASPTMPAGGGVTTSPASTTTAPAAATSGGILDLLSGLTSGGLWTRLGAFLLGGILILFSLWKLTGAGDVIVQAAGLATKGVIGAK